MRNIWTLAKKEYKNYFNSPIAYIVGFVILLVLGIFFALNITYLTLNSYLSYGAAPDVGVVTGPFAFMLVLSTPALTMGLLADEKRMGTMELLMTAPLRDVELVVGKWLGAFLFMLTVMAITLIFPIMMFFLVYPGIDGGQVFGAYLGIMLITSAFLSIGVGISALFSNQLAAFFTTLITFIVLWWIIGFPANILPAGSDIFHYLDMQTHFYNSLNVGVIKLTDIIYFLSLTALGLFIGKSAVEMRRLQS
ncbi:MAG: hypothetical protein B5M51_05895 [Anaerolinea sp. 4484_236]|nr:MAG: hypothetical protein B5M51_05895 [Anaerolinea sp. 4484_236]